MTQQMIVCDPCIFRREDGTLAYVGPDECIFNVLERVSAAMAAGLRPADVDIATVESLPIFDEAVLEPAHIILT